MTFLSKQKWITPFFLIFFPFFLNAQSAKILTNHIGYEDSKSKKAIIISDKKADFSSFQLVETETGKVAFSGKPVFSGPVNKWKNWLFWTIDFSAFSQKGNYIIKAVNAGNTVASFPFIIDKNVLEQSTLSNVVYYFKGQRSSGLLDKADRTLILSGHPKDTIDAHGGWYDATGDYGKHLSHLTFSSFFQPTTNIANGLVTFQDLSTISAKKRK